MPPLEHFDLLAPLYDRMVKAPEELAIHRYLKAEEGRRLLDAGGGTGRIANALADDFETTVVLDESLPMLRQSAEKGCCHIVAGQTEHPPFAESSFDRIIIVDAFHHLANQQVSLAELWRLLSQGGRLVIEEPDIKHWGVKVVALIEKIVLMRSQFIAAEEIANQLRDLGGGVDVQREGYTAWVIADKAA